MNLPALPLGREDRLLLLPNASSAELMLAGNVESAMDWPCPAPPFRVVRFPQRYEVRNVERLLAAGMLNWAVRWNTVRCPACSAITGIAWMPDEPAC